MKHILLFIVSLVLVTSCTKTEGIGGGATIKGKIFARDFDNDGDLKAEYYLPEKDVYIIYGQDSSFYSDDVKTHFDGSFQFEYLRPGNYQIFTYSKCMNCEAPTEAIFRDAVIVNNDDVIDLGDIIVEE